MSRVMYRYQVPVGGAVKIGLTGDPVALDSGAVGESVEFWAVHDDGKPEILRTFVVLGTGQPIPDGFLYVGTAPRTPEGLVWHLFEVW